jgi:cobalamin synthase
MPTEKQLRRRARVHAHPVQASAIGAAVLFVPQFLLSNPTDRPLWKLAVLAVFASLLGFGLFVVFRNPAFVDPSADQDFGRKVWHKAALGFLLVLALLTVVASVAAGAWGGLVVAGFLAAVPIAFIVERLRDSARP